MSSHQLYHISTSAIIPTISRNQYTADYAPDYFLSHAFSTTPQTWSQTTPSSQHCLYNPFHLSSHLPHSGAHIAPPAHSLPPQSGVQISRYSQFPISPPGPLSQATPSSHSSTYPGSSPGTGGKNYPCCALDLICLLPAVTHAAKFKCLFTLLYNLASS